jgi:chemotaxis methyl-accepting protein methylase/CheY-like chemotaxis protein
MFKMTDSDLIILYKLVEEITGTSQQGQKKKEIIQNSLTSRLETLKINDFSQYLKKIKHESQEYAIFVNLITIHTTSWFREMPHFNDLENRVESLYKGGQKHFRIISLACSTGQEVYSTALLMQSLSERLPQLSFEIVGTDIDPLSIAIGQRCIYKNEELSQIPKKFQSQILMGFNKNQGFFTLEASLRKKVSFRNLNLKDGFDHLFGEKFDFIFLRNVLIYFDLHEALKIVSHCAEILTDQGLLLLGHSEFPVDIPSQLTRFSPSCLKKNLKFTSSQKISKISEIKKTNTASSIPDNRSSGKRRLLLIDDFTVIRASIKSALADCNFLIDEAASAEKASEMLEHNTYDLITLDINLPGENGTQWLRRQRASGLKTPIVIISSTEAKEAALVFGALSDGAQDYISKEVLYKNRSELVATVNALIYSDKSKTQHQSVVRTGKKQNYLTGAKVSPDVIVIGSSS